MTASSPQRIIADHPEEECAVFGIYDMAGDAARMTYFGLQALQHRGQESAGIAVDDGASIQVKKDLGLVTEVFSEHNLTRLEGVAAIGHCRYSTSGEVGSVQSAHPFVVQVGSTRVALAHNGTLTNPGELVDYLENAHVHEEIHTDSEAAAYIIAHETEKSGSVTAGIAAAMQIMRGAYAMVVIAQGALYAFRDPHGIRPLTAGKLPGGGWAVASETCGLDIVGADELRDVGPGEVIRLNKEGMTVTQGTAPAHRSTCIFEYVYFARPDSVIDGRTVYQSRVSMGRMLAHEAPAQADLVLGVPDSGVPGALGFSQVSGIPFADGIVKNRYTHRTFIEPTQALRRQGIRIKLNPLPSVIAGKRLVVVDDSIVRGNTAKELVQMLRDTGAAEVHLRIICPEVKWPCFYGIDTAARGQLLSANMDVEEARAWLGADSLAFLSEAGLIDAVRGYGPTVDATTDRCTHDGFCLACFNGEYPVR